MEPDVVQQTATILVVDDEEANRDVIGRRLERAGYRVLKADSGATALAILEQQAIDLVLLDILMPGISGLEVLKRIRASDASRHLPTIMVTARAQTEDYVEALDLGADDYVTKPINFAVVLARVRTQVARRRAELALSESEERYALAVQGTNDGVWDWRPDTGEVYFSPRWKSIMGYDEADVVTGLDCWFERIHPDDVDRVRRELDEHVRGDSEKFESEYRVRRVDTFRWVLARGRAVRDENGRAVRLAGSITDITGGKVADALTGLPNRVLFNDRLSRLFEHAKRVNGFQFAVLFLDLDRFKNVNDSLGHRAGDRLLVETARRLEHNLRATDSVSRLEAAGAERPRAADHTVARFGGDEFAIILGGISQPSDATRVAERIAQALSEGFVLEGQEVFVSASIGIALSVTGYEHAEDMLRDADTALYRAKAGGRGRCELFDAAMREQVVQRLRLETDLRHAVARGELILHYQPVVSMTSGAVTGVEALLRWQHPARGLLMPADFLTIAEETNLIVPVGYWTVEEVCRQLRAWRAEHGDDLDLVVAINLSARQLLSAGFVERITEIADEHGISHRQIEFEIGEAVMMTDPERVFGIVGQLKGAGFRISVDDFGTGYSSLSYLQRFPVDRLKLDRSFLQEMAVQSEARTIMESVVLLADHLHLEVVAEGIETIAQLGHVQSLRCDFGQGFLFSRPVPPGSDANWLSNLNWHAPRRAAAGGPASGGRAAGEDAGGPAAGEPGVAVGAAGANRK